MHLEEILAQITPIDEECRALAQKRYDDLIKPLGSLAKLEEMITHYAGIIGKHLKSELTYPKRDLLVWAAPEQTKETTKLLQGEYPVNILAALTEAKTIPLQVMALTEEEAMAEGAMLVSEYIKEEKLGLLGFGCLAAADNELVLAAMAGGILQAAALKVPVMLDGLATCRAAAKAAELAPLVKSYVFAGHVSDEPGAEEAVAALGLSAPLRLNIADGAGEGAAVAFTLFNAGIRAYLEMETFAEAGVHEEVKEFSHHEQVKDGKEK